jgi:HEAT repeat protein
MRVLCVLLLLCACKPADPKDPKTWEKQLSDSEPRVRSKAIQELRKLNAREAAPQIAQLLKDPLCKEDAALALQDLGGPSEVQPLVSAIDTTIGSGSDLATRSTNRTNAKIATALGNIGAQDAAPSLLRLARASDDGVRLAAIEALGKVKAKDAVAELSHVVDDPATPPLLIKRALAALGEIGDPAGISALTHGLVLERQGVSFLPEASFSLFQIGEPSVGPLLKIIQDQDSAWIAWARDNDRPAAGTYAKAAMVLGDLGDPRATPVLIARLRYTDPDPQPGTSRLLSDLVRAFAAQALGRLRAKEAAAPIQALISPKDEGDLPQFASEALVYIGERGQAKELLKKADTAGPRGRQALGQAAGLFGEAGLAKELQALAAKSTAKGGCAKELAELGAPESDKPCEALAKPLRDGVAALEAARQCSQPSCWSSKLSAPQPAVRARAALELGRAQAADAVPALTKACSEEELLVRAAAIRALDWLAAVPAAKAGLVDAARKLREQLDQEQGKTRFSDVDEDLRRLQFKLSRL